MILLRFLLLVFNVAVIGYLIFYMVEAFKQPMDRGKKILIVAGGICLLLAPLGIFFKIFLPTAQYVVIYPVAISLFIYFTKKM